MRVDRDPRRGEASGGRPLRLVVVGGGFTGTILVIHLLRATGRPLDIVVVEPAEELGRGIAYSTPDPAHRINVPSDRMGIAQDDPGEATRWFFEHGILPDRGSADGQGHFYVPRRAYGAYVGDVLRRTLAEAGPRATFRHLRRSAAAVARGEGDWSVELDDGSRLAADVVALCFGHAVPHLPCSLPDEVRRHPKLVRDPWDRTALAAIEPRDAVLIVGTGLSMADVVLGLRAKGHTGPITAVSRRGLLSRPQGLFIGDIDFLAGEAPPTTALGLLRLARRRVREADPGLGWQPIADALRSGLPVIWGALPAGEKARVLRRLLPFWDVHRFRIAPQVHEALARDTETGGFRVERGGLDGLARDGDRLIVSLTRPAGERDTRAFDAVVLCTGPEKDLRNNRLVASLLGSGLARLDDTGLGIAVDARSRVLDRDGRATPTLLAFGPMTRGTFGEMTGAPDITRHMSHLAARMLDGIEAEPSQRREATPRAVA